MNIVNSGTTYQIFDESVKTFQELPVGCYQITFNKMTGFSLVKHNDLLVLEEKIYGDSEKKVDKILQSYRLSDRNFGVILSGDKGIGKSLFAKILANKANALGIPLILATKNYPGLEDFISSIDGEVVVLFDEFEKNFPCEYEYDEECDREFGADGGSQNSLLSLFDGIDNGKKLFVITCNDTYKLSKYFLNRPGRFHYHFKLQQPTSIEIEEYLKDKLDEKYYGVIPSIISMSAIGSITYDCLRALAFDINQGYSLDDTLNCLNLTRDRNIQLRFTIVLDNNKVFTNTEYIDLFQDSKRGMYLNGDNGEEMKIVFTPTAIKYINNTLTLDVSDTKLTYYNENSYGEVALTDNGNRVSKDKSNMPRIIAIKIEKVDASFMYKYMI